jgi:hypothetical protein
MVKLRPVILLLAFALLIQNTCPQGFAGKTSLASTCAHCPLKQLFSAPSGMSSLSGAFSSVHFPLFVFSLPKTDHTFKLDLIKTERPILPNGYEDALPHEILRPPQA